MGRGPNLVHGRIGRNWMAVRDMDIAAQLMGIRLLPAKLLAFAVSSFYAGVAGALMVFMWLGAAEPKPSTSTCRSSSCSWSSSAVGSMIGSFLPPALIHILPIIVRAAPASLG